MEIISKYSVVVDYSKNYPVGYYMIRKSKRAGVANINLAIVQFNITGIRSYEIRSELDKMGLRPAELSELLAIKEFTQLKERTIIFALGSIIQCGLYVGTCPFIAIKEGSITTCDIAHIEGGLGQACFAAVYK